MVLNRREFVSCILALLQGRPKAEGAEVLDPHVVWVRQSRGNTQALVRIYRTVLGQGVDVSGRSAPILREGALTLPDPRILRRDIIMSRRLDLGAELSFEETVKAINEDIQYAKTLLPKSVDYVLEAKPSSPEVRGPGPAVVPE